MWLPLIRDSEVNMRLFLFIIWRIFQLAPVLIGVSAITFVSARLLPGDAAILAAGPTASQEAIDELREEMRLDRPIWEQYGAYLRDVFQGNLGESWRSRRPATDELFARFPASFELVTFSMTLAVIMGVPLGVFAAVRHGGRLDQVVRMLSVGGISIPIFWSGLMLIYVLFYLLHLAPAPIGRIGLGISPPQHITGLYILDSLLTLDGRALLSSLHHLMLPAITMSIAMVAPIVRITRSSMLDVLREDHIRTAWASGLSSRTIHFRDALRNALLPVITLIAGYYGYSLGGEVLVEQIFSWPGMGRYSVDAIFNLDYAPVQAFVMLTALLYILIYTVVDILYAFVDPRVRY